MPFNTQCCNAWVFSFKNNFGVGIGSDGGAPAPAFVRTLITNFSSESTVEQFTILYGDGEYTDETLTNVSAVTYTINDVDTALPFTLAINDVLKISITKTASGTAKVIING